MFFRDYIIYPSDKKGKMKKKGGNTLSIGRKDEWYYLILDPKHKDIMFEADWHQ